MTIKEAILKSLEEINGIANYMKVYEHIIAKKYYVFAAARPTATVSAELGHFIRSGDTRVKRIKQAGGTYSYYLSKIEENIDFVTIPVLDEIAPTLKGEKTKTYLEKDLHKLLSSYLKNEGIYSKTIPHEQSNGKDRNQTWTHPDMVGVRFLKLKTEASQKLLKAINRVGTFTLTSYEIKKEINSDVELKQAFFQAVSNSSWANYGYLVAFEFRSDLNEEIKRLNESFGIGVIKLSANPFQSEVLFQPKYRDLDFKTIDKLCFISPDFEKYIHQIESFINAPEQYSKSTEKELDAFCDKYFPADADTEISAYCKEKQIPIETLEAATILE
jgi:hypothetical protein